MDGTDTITVENPTWDVADVQSGQKGGRFLGEFSDPSRLRDPATMDELTAAIHDLGPAPNGEAAMNRLERFIANVIANHPAMISIKDLQLRYRMANADLVQLFGMPLEQVLGRTASELLPGVGPAIDAQGTRAIATLETIHGDYELEVGGEPRTFHLVSFAMTDDANRPVELCCIASDVTDSRREQHANRLRAEATDLIWSALSEDRMVLTSQPVVEITTQHPVSEELLVRLALSGDGGLLQPSAFLPVAERFNLIQEIDSWMVSRAVTIAGDRAVQVNLSAVTLSDETARKRILATLASHPSAAARIVFEITETAAAHHFDAARQFAAALTELGCGLALDDFGTGFGSFTYLRHLPLRYLKIDRSFVTNLPNSLDDRRVVSSIIGIARQFDLLTIAEGVEDAATLAALDDLGADFAQGFHFGRPAPVEPGGSVPARPT
jgi:PAS domain S-box-containing protein